MGKGERGRVGDRDRDRLLVSKYPFDCVDSSLLTYADVVLCLFSCLFKRRVDIGHLFAWL